MKHSSNKKPAVPVAKQKAKKISVSAKKIVSTEKNESVSATKTKAVQARTVIGTSKSKRQKTETSAPTRKVKNADTNKKQIVPVQKVKSVSKTIKQKDSDANLKIIKPKSAVPVKKKTVAKHQKTVGKIATEKSEKSVAAEKVLVKKSQPRVSVWKKTPQNEKNIQTANIVRLPKNAAIKKVKKSESKILVKAAKPVKSQPKVSTEKVQPKTSGTKSKITDVKLKKIAEKKTIKKDAPTKINKTQKTPVKIEKKRANSRISKIPKVENQKIVAVHLVKKLNLPKSIAAPKSKNKGRPKLIKPVEVIAETPVLITPKPKPKKAKAISSAVFRGEKNKYDFTVFPLDAVFEDVPAIYIISRRVVDKSKKAHHAVVRIGQTESLLDELKKHKKDKRAKKFAANSISLLREENENRRLKIETDLKAAHAIRCLHA